MTRDHFILRDTSSPPKSGVRIRLGLDRILFKVRYGHRDRPCGALQIGGVTALGCDFGKEVTEQESSEDELDGREDL